MKRLLSCLCVAIGVASVMPSPSGAQSGFNQNGPFLGAWCAQGDPSKHASISANGPFNLNLTNENGSTSTGMITGLNSRQITAPQWNLVQGNLSADGQTINWSNSTYWSRCRRHRNINLSGTWYVGGDQSRACRIDQHHGSLRLRNETGQTGSGTFTNSRRISTLWSDTPIAGAISADGNRIDWSNGTYWTR